MTQPDDTPLSPAEQEVRRLLAAARHTDPVPPDVAARLDGVLAGLAAGEHDGPTGPPAPAPVTDLDVHRRRRRVGQLLVAAAAVVVLGVGLNQVIDRADQAGTASDSAEAPSAALDGGQEESSAGGAGAGSRAEPQPSSADQYLAALKPVPIRPRTFDADVLELRRSKLYAAFADQPQDRTEADTQAQAGELAAGAACRSRSWGSGTFVPVSYGGSPAVLVLRRPQGDTQVADLYLCGATTPVRSVTLPAP